MGRLFAYSSLVLLLLQATAQAAGYQASVSFGMDKPSATETRGPATLVQTQFSTFNKLLRLQSAFSGLFGSGYLEGEGALGLGLYLVAPFVSKSAPVQPFLTTMGTFGVGTLNEKDRMDTGYAYGAGVDLLLYDHSGFTITIQQHNATEKSLRYAIGFFWFRGTFN